MNIDFKDSVWKGGFRPTLESEGFEDRIRGKLGLTAKYESARLCIGRSLNEPSSPDPIRLSNDERGKAIAGEYLFGDDIDLWLSVICLDGQFGVNATPDDFRTLVEAHWARGARLLQQDLEDCNDDEIRLMTRLADLLPASFGSTRDGGSLQQGAKGEITLTVGTVSRTLSGDEHVAIPLNAQGAAPHIALMGRNGTGKTTTGVQIARQIVERAAIPMLFIDPKGEFVKKGKVCGALAEGFPGIRAIEVGEEAIPLEFLPDPSIGNASITQAAMQFRDSIALCCGHPGDIQLDLLRSAVEKVIKHERPRDLPAVREWYRQELQNAGKKHDSIASRLNELTSLKVFSTGMHPSEFFQQSWVLSLKTLGTEELKKVVILLILDSLRSFMLSQQDTDVVEGFRSLRHLLVIDEARRILMNKKYQSLVDLVRQGRSKGEVLMLLSQDPSDFDGQADDFTKQLGTIIAFACAQSERGLRSLQGAFGRRLQPNEFSDTFLPTGVAFTKLWNRMPERIKCWQPSAEPARD
jgi:DNA sulfur modification protein DndE